MQIAPAVARISAILGIMFCHSVGAAQSSGELTKICSNLAALTEKVAQEAASTGRSAHETDFYRQIKFNFNLSAEADAIANHVNVMKSDLKPSVIAATLMYSCVYAGTDQAIIGERKEIGKSCNAALAGTEVDCVIKFAKRLSEQLTNSASSKN